MKIFKKIMCATMAVALSMVFAGCGEGDNPGEGKEPETPVEQSKKLATPQNVTVSDTGLITWGSVENAEYYIVVHNGNKYRANTTSYQVGSVINDFTYAVYAVAKQGYENSDVSETKTFKGKGIPVVIDPLIANLTVSVTGKQLVGSGKETRLSATVNFPDGNTNKSVIWSMADGEEYASISDSGLFTANEVTEDHDVTVRATSTDNKDKFAELVICVACQPTITDEMLSGVKDPYLGFEGYTDIDLYTFGLYENFVRTVTLPGISTHMNGERWHASYVDTNGYTNEIHYKKDENGMAQQVALSLLNDEEYYPMTDERGDAVSWTDAGLYNNFTTLKASDFAFDEDDWRYYYVGGNNDLLQKMVASATPYEFDAKRFGLIIEDGEFLGIYAESNDSYSLVEGYKASQKLYCYINSGEENVTVPEIGKFEHNPGTTDGGHIDHDTLDKAIANMQALKSYTMDVTISSHMASGYVINGYFETVTDGDYYFRPYDVDRNDQQHPIMKAGQEYGFHKIDDETYNSYNYDAETGRFVASRAFKDDMKNAKASFAFASEIFTMYGEGTFNGDPVKIYYADESMCTVASTFYYGVGNDMPLYGLYAMFYQGLGNYTPFVVVQNDYIVRTGFFYFLGDMYGEVVIDYGDFNTAELPEDVNFDDFVPRTPPASWSELTVIDETLNGNGKEVNALEFFTEMFGEEVEYLPFFGDEFGDTFGFALATYRAPGGMSNQVPTVVLYYDVPLEADRTIDATIKRAQEFLVRLGFTKNNYGEYVRGNITALPYDSSLDFQIYIWKTV